MKKATTFLIGVFLMCFSAKSVALSAENPSTSYNYGQRFIFVEGGVEFSVFPDGQFDFVYLGRKRASNFSLQIGSPNVNISFNAGYDYDMYVQYDMYGAVIQIENVPVYYDVYGRIVQAGNVHISYKGWHLVRIGGLFVHYDHYGHYSHYSGFINRWNRHYIARPWHRYYVRPVYSHCIVYDFPYRRHYDPIRYSHTHHLKYFKKRGGAKHYNGKRDFYRPGSRTHYKNGRVALNKDFNPRKKRAVIGRKAINNRVSSRVGNTRNQVQNDRGHKERGRSPSVEERRNPRSRVAVTPQERSNVSRGDYSQNSNSRHSRTVRTNTRAQRQSESISDKRNASKQRTNVVRGSSVKRKATSNRKNIEQVSSSKKKSTTRRGRSSRGGRR